MIYKFRKNSFVKGGLDAQEIGEALEAIRIRFGRLETERVLSQASNPRSILHAAFEWDDEVAANQHRLDEARTLVRSVEIIITQGEEPEPAFVHVRESDGGGYYQSTRIAVKNKSEWDAVYADAVAALNIADRNLSRLLQIAGRLKNGKIGKIKKARVSVAKATEELTV